MKEETECLRGGSLDPSGADAGASGASREGEHRFAPVRGADAAAAARRVSVQIRDAALDPENTTRELGMLLSIARAWEMFAEEIER